MIKISFSDEWEKNVVPVVFFCVLNRRAFERSCHLSKDL